MKRLYPAVDGGESQCPREDIFPPRAGVEKGPSRKAVNCWVRKEIAAWFVDTRIVSVARWDRPDVAQEVGRNMPNAAGLKEKA